jgi:hypothetical protein
MDELALLNQSARENALERFRVIQHDQLTLDEIERIAI